MTNQQTEWIRIPVLQEALQVGRRVVETGRALQVEKSVHGESLRVDDSVKRQQLQVERVPCGQMLASGEVPVQRYEGDTLVVPVLEEVLVVEKRMRLVEEVRIRASLQTENVSQQVELRREEIRTAFVERPEARGSPVPPPARPEANPSTRRQIMRSTVMAVFDDYASAQGALDALHAAGFTASDARLSPAENTRQSREAALRSQSSATTGKGGGIGDFFRSLFGMERHSDEDVDLYAEAMRRGSCVVSVDAATDERRDEAADIVRSFHPVDIGQRAQQWRSGGWTSYDPSSALLSEDEILTERTAYATTPADTGVEATIPVIEEQLKVGKRAILKGGVRVYQRIEETPVQEQVTLREENVRVERTPVDQPASPEDLRAFKEGTLEVRETAEEPVVEKTARVVEEVRVGKETTEHVETVGDTVRRTDVEVEKLAPQGGGATRLSAEDEDFRRHWQSAYGGSGRYEDYSEAYRYGTDLAGNARYQNYRSWEELEPQVRSEWETGHAGSTWERTRDAIRYAWEKRHH